MKKAAYFLPLVALAGLSACQDDVSPVGNTLSRGEVVISIDTLEVSLDGRSVYFDQFDSRAATNLIGRLATEEYGRLDCSYVTRFLPTPSLGIPDKVPMEDIDSMKLVISVPRGSFAGDSLAPQQLKVYRLNRQLPADLTNRFDPEGSYDPSAPLAEKNYTLSALAMTDEGFASDKSIQIRMPLSREFLESVVNEYRNHKETFAWPSSFAQWFPGIYVCHSFGRGAVANVTQTKTLLYYHYVTSETVYEDGAVVTRDKTVVDSVSNFVTSPAVLSANRVSYTPSGSLNALAARSTVVTTPGGYIASVKIPVAEILEKYRRKVNSLSVISDLTFSIPAKSIESEVSLSLPPYLLMVPKDKVEEFFANNSIPDGKSSFWASYNSSSQRYSFTSLRSYILDMAALPDVTDEEREFLLVPVLIQQEDVKDAYGNVTGYRVVSCTPYMAAPTMGVLDTTKARFIFTFSQQTLE